MYIAKSGHLLERMVKSGVDVVSLDWTVTIDEARARMGNKVRVPSFQIFTVSGLRGAGEAR